MGSKPAFSPRLVIIDGNDKGKIIPLISGTAVIGRSKGNILVQDPRVSRSHVALHYDDRVQKLTFTDLKSLNGTLVNDEPKESGDLHDGDKLKIGDTVFDCQILPPEDNQSESSFAAILKKSKIHKEPKLVPLENLVADSHEWEARDREPTSDVDRRFLTNKIRSVYLGVPSTIRTITLLLLIAVGLLVYIRASRVGSGIERDLASVRSLQQLGRTADAISKAEEMRRRYPSNGQVHLLLGDLYAAEKKDEQALAEYHSVHEQNPPLPLSHVRLMKLFITAGLVTEAQEEVKHIDQLIKEGNKDKEVVVEAAKLFLEFSDLKLPIENALGLAKLLEEEVAPTEAVGYKLEAFVYVQKNQIGDAVKALEKARQYAPEDEWILENLTIGRLANKDVGGAFEIVKNWLEHKPDSTRALLLMAYFKLNEKNSSEALSYLHKILQNASKNPKDPYYPEALHLVGQVYLQQKQSESARKFFEASCKLGFERSCPLAMHDPSSNPPQSNQKQNDLPKP
ncbi:MAG: FHA domain-containing protein [Deltaproteobacteria bacterium]|nr:FHA domain-containing protein [Deltaproteobacteria bacterium]